MAVATMANFEVYEKQIVDGVDILYMDDRFEPNRETIDAMNEARHGDLIKFNSIEELMAELNADD